MKTCGSVGLRVVHATIEVVSLKAGMPPCTCNSKKNEVELLGDASYREQRAACRVTRSPERKSQPWGHYASLSYIRYMCWSSLAPVVPHIVVNKSTVSDI